MMKTTTFSKIANSSTPATNSTASSSSSHHRMPSSKSSNCFTYQSTNDAHTAVPSATQPPLTPLQPQLTQWRRSDSNLTSFKKPASPKRELNVHEIVNEAIGVDYLTPSDSYYYYYPPCNNNTMNIQSGDSDELIFSDHAGLFESLTKANCGVVSSSNGAHQPNHESMLQESINKNLFRMAKQHYKLTNVSNENLCEYESGGDEDDHDEDAYYEDDEEECDDDEHPTADSINNWSMRLSNQNKQRRLIKLLSKSSSCGNNSSSSAAGSASMLLLTGSSNTSTGSTKSSQTTSWNKLKQSSSNFNNSSNNNNNNNNNNNSASNSNNTVAKQSRQLKPARRTVTEPCCLDDIHMSDMKRLSLIKLYQTRQQCQRDSHCCAVKENQNINALNIYNNFSSSDISHTDTASTPTSTMLPQTTQSNFDILTMEKTKNDRNNSFNNNVKIRKSPTITFGELKSRSTTQLAPPIQTIGTQYPPRVTDQCIQTSYVHADEPHLVLTINEEKLTLKRAFYKSLPDLSFLNEYSSVNYSQLLSKEDIAKFEASTFNALLDCIDATTGGFTMSADLKLLINSSSNQSSLSASTQLAQQAQEKRKTLKSIKRYRQTKQVTEPCALIPTENIPLNANINLRATNSFSSKSAVNKIIVVPTNLSPPPTPKRQIASNQTPLNQNNTQQTQHPSTNSSSSSSSSGYQSACTNQGMPLKSCLKNRNESVMRAPALNNTATATDVHRRNSSIHLLNRSPSSKISARSSSNSHSLHIPSIGWLFTCDSKSLKKYSYYKKIASERKEENDSDVEEDFDDDDDDDNDEENDNDDEVIEEEENSVADDDDEEQDAVGDDNNDNDECEMRNKKSVSFCEKISHHTITPPTSHSSPIHVVGLGKSEPLHYESLIKMLRGSNVPVEVKAASEKKLLLQHHKCHSAIAIEADAISLASLNESPPNEFKFSDDDCEEHNAHNISENSKVGFGVLRINNGEAVGTELHANLKDNQRELNEKLNQFLLNNSNLRHINANYSTNPYIVELKAIVSELKQMNKVQQILDNEKCSSLDKILREGLCKVLFELLKENLKLFSYQSSKQTSRNDEMRYEKLCSLFESLLARLSSNANNNSFGQSVGKKINETFILNEVNPIQKFEAFIYFFLNCKQLANIFESLHNDKLLLHKYYENLASRVTFLSISDNCKQLNSLKFNLKYYFNAKTITTTSSTNPTSPISPNTIQTKTVSRPQPISQPPPVNRQSTIRKNSLRLPVSTPPSTSPVSNLIPPQKPQCVATIHVSKQKQLIPSGSLSNKSTLSSNSNNSNVANNNNNNNGVGFHLKNLSKKLNIKSWFHSSSNNQSHSPQATVKAANSVAVAKKSVSQFNYSDPMKISISEPMISEIGNNSNANANTLTKNKK